MMLGGKAVLITGGRRVGGVLARALADRGARLAMTHRSSRRAIEATLDDCRARGAEGLAVAADLADPDQAEAAVAAVVERFGRIDVLVNMASIYEKTPFRELTPEHYRRMIDANLSAPYFAAVAAGKAMLDQGPMLDASGLSGKIVQLGDWSTERPRTGYLPYVVAKGGLTTLTMALAKELAPRVAVNMVQPATIDPPPGLGDAERSAIERATPLGRIGDPGDAVTAILWLLEGTDFATGACYRVDGGRYLGVDDEST